MPASENLLDSAGESSPQGGAHVQEELQTNTDVVLLDGGMGHQLKAMGVEIKGVVGSMERFLGVAMANTRNPDLV